MDPAVTVGALLRDLVAGARAIAASADVHGARHTLRLFEALDERDRSATSPSRPDRVLSARALRVRTRLGVARNFRPAGRRLTSASFDATDRGEWFLWRE